MQQGLIVDASDALLSIRSTTQQHSQALASLGQFIARLAIQSTPTSTNQTRQQFDAFLKLQDSFRYNLTAILLEWLGRTIAKQEAGAQDVEILRSNMISCMELLRGLQLLHRQSQLLLERRSAMEYVLAVVDLSRPSHSSSPLLGSAPAKSSPVVLPVSPAISNQSDQSPRLSQGSPASSPTALSLAALEALLCALVDRPSNVRTFEKCDGLATVVRVLKDKSVAHVVRIKVIEILYYYLLPEETVPRRATSLASSLGSSTAVDDLSDDTPLHSLLARAADFVPQTPMKPSRYRNHFSGDGQRTPSYKSGVTTPVSKQSQNGLDSESNGREDEDADTPKAIGKKLYQQTNGTPLGIRRTPSTRHVSEPVKTPAGGHGRSVEDKRELLRRVMPNVDALEDRFAAMGLGNAWS